MAWLSGALSGIGSIAQSIGSSVQARKNRAFAKQESELQYQRSIEHWNRQNQYNDPSAQMARLKAAGLNPNMVYGTGSKAANTTNQDVQYTPPEGKFGNPVPDVQGPLNHFQDVRMNNAQKGAIDAQAHLARVKASLEVLKVPSLVNQNEQERIKKEVMEATQFEYMKAKTDALRTTMDVQQQQMKIKEFELKAADKNWQWFRDYNVRPSDPYWIRDIVTEAKKASNDGSLQQVKAYINQKINEAKHLMNLGLGKQIFETPWN